MHFSTHRPPSVLELATRRPRRPASTLDDMADNAAGLLDALGIDLPTSSAPRWAR